MKEFRDKVAVVTGAASGIGRSIADRCALEGMKVVLADIELPALQQAKREMSRTGATVLAVKTDVSKAGDVEALAQKTLDAFGGVHLLFNNAGVGNLGTMWEYSQAEWEWVLGVNLWGIIHGLPRVRPHYADAGHRLPNRQYGINRRVSALPPQRNIPSDETRSGGALRAALLLARAKEHEGQGVGALSRMGEHAHPGGGPEPSAELADISGDAAADPVRDTVMHEMREAVRTGMPPQQVADCVFDAIEAERFYILTHPEFKPVIRARMEGILETGRPPAL